jgi:uncharacterized protein YdeI (YjbR/CyaY-like superfamily)
MNPQVDEYLERLQKWPEELQGLRTIVLECMLTETVKWGVPCYTYQDANLLMLGSFKEFCCISFFKGVLMSDPHGILTSPGENSQSVKMVKFTNLQEIINLKPILKEYIYEAIEVESLGLKVETKKLSDLEFAEELIQVLSQDSIFKKAFEALTPGRQRAYNLFFTAAKQPSTRLSRIEKYRQQILDGKGINDCTCGLSKRMPTCDGSHKFKDASNLVLKKGL